MRTTGAAVAFVGLWEVVLGVFLYFEYDRYVGSNWLPNDPTPGLTLIWVGGVVLAAGGILYLVGRIRVRS